MDVKAESTIKGQITASRKRLWIRKTEERKDRRYRTKLRKARHKRGR